MDTVTRSQLVGELQGVLRQIDAVDAAWEGGSAAFGRAELLTLIDALLSS